MSDDRRLFQPLGGAHDEPDNEIWSVTQEMFFWKNLQKRGGETIPRLFY